MNYSTELAESFRRQAAWRREKAAQHPEDRRNLDAARIFDELASQTDRASFDRDLFGRYCDLAYADDDTSVTVSVETNELFRAIGFSEWPSMVDQFLEELLARVRRAS